MKTPIHFIMRKAILFILLLPALSFAQNITRLEYFIDIDPGFGNAIAIPLSPAPDITNINLNVDISNLSVGYHYLYVRGMDAAGRWGLTNTLGFYKEKDVFTLPPWANAEFFIDIDPGFGQATQLAMVPGAGFDSIVTSIPVTYLSQGFHYLYVRSKDSLGSWSLTNTLPFYKDKDHHVLYPIVEVEFFVDTDPGFGNGTPITFLPDTLLPNLIDSINTAALQPGFHNIYVRARDGNGRWSLTNVLPFYKQEISSAYPEIVYIESFMGNDPGFGNAAGFSVPPSSNISNADFYVDQCCMADGDTAFLYVRAKDNNGIWGLTNIDTLVKKPLAINAPDTLVICYADSVKLSTSKAPGLSYDWLYNGNPISGAHDSILYAHLTGNYNAIIGNQSGCSDTSTPVYVSVKPLIQPPVVVSPVIYCQFDPASALTATGSGLQWYQQPQGGSGSPVAPIPATSVSGTVNYFVAQTIDGCESARDTISVIVNPKPATPTITISNDTLYSSAPSGNQWYDSSGILTGQTLHWLLPSASGEYYVISTANNCSSDTSDHFHYTISNIESFGNENESFLLYPNPANAFLNIKRDHDTKSMVFIISDVHGRVLYNGQLTGTLNRVPILFLPNGVYLISIEGKHKLPFCVIR